MEFNISLVKATGSPDASGWSQVHEYKPDDNDKYQKRGRIIAVISTRLSTDDQTTFGKELITRLHEEYFGNLEATAYNALKEAVGVVYKEFNNPPLVIEISVVAMVGEVLYAVSAGGSGVAVYRGNMLAKIIASGNEGVVDASGYPKDGDLLIIGSSKFFAKFAEAEIIEILKSRDVEKIQEDFAGKIMNEDEAGKMAVAVLGFTQTEKEDSEEIARDLNEEDKSVNQGSETAVGKNIIKGVLDKLISVIPAKKIYLKPRLTDLEAVKSKKTTLSVGIILLAILIVSIGLGIKQKKLKEEKQVYIDKLQNAIHNYDEAVSLSDVNEERARELIYGSREITNSLLNQGIKDEDLKSLSEKIITLQEELLKEYGVTSSSFLNLTLLTDNFKTIETSANEDRIVILDSGGSRVAEVGFDGKNPKIISGPNDITGIDHLALYSQKTYALAKDGVYELDENKKVIEKDFSDDSLIFAFAGNIYVLDKNQNQIIRFPGNEGVFSKGSGWINDGVTVDLSDARNMVIDGSIWVSFDDGNILKLTQGNVDTFEIKGVVPQINKIDFVYTQSELSNIYLLEKDKGRVVVINKNGEYLGQYLNGDLKDTFSIAVSEKEKRIAFPKNDELFQFALK